MNLLWRIFGKAPTASAWGPLLTAIGTRQWYLFFNLGQDFRRNLRPRGIRWRENSTLTLLRGLIEIEIRCPQNVSVNFRGDTSRNHPSRNDVPNELSVLLRLNGYASKHLTWERCEIFKDGDLICGGLFLSLNVLQVGQEKSAENQSGTKRHCIRFHFCNPPEGKFGSAKVSLFGELPVNYSVA